MKVEFDETRTHYPGSLWLRAEQCDAHRPNSKVCFPKKIVWDECKQLCCDWYNISAPLTGTSCGEHGDKWCEKGECVAKYHHKGISMNDVDTVKPG